MFVLKHRERQCFQYVGRTADGQRGGVFAACADLLKSTFDGTLAEPIAALLVVSMAADWDFHYLPLADDGRYHCRTALFCIGPLFCTLASPRFQLGYYPLF